MTRLEELQEQRKKLDEEYNSIPRADLIRLESEKERDNLKREIEAKIGKPYGTWNRLDIAQYVDNDPEKKADMEKLEDDRVWLTDKGKEYYDKYLVLEEEIEQEKMVLYEIKPPRRMPDTRRLQRKDFDQLQYQNLSITMNAVTQLNATLITLQSLMSAMAHKMGVNVEDAIDKGHWKQD